MTDQKAKLPKTVLNVEYVTIAGTKMVQVQPEGDKVTIGDQTTLVPKDRIGFDKKKGGAWCRVSEGNPVALPLFQEGHQDVTAKQLDQTAHNNYLEQLNNLAKANKTPPMQWVTIICLGILSLIVIGVAVAQHNDIKDLKGELVKLQPGAGCTPTPGHPCTGAGTQPAQPQQGGGYLVGSPQDPNRVP